MQKMTGLPSESQHEKKMRCGPIAHRGEESHGRTALSREIHERATRARESSPTTLPLGSARWARGLLVHGALGQPEYLPAGSLF